MPVNIASDRCLSKWDMIQRLRKSNLEKVKTSCCSKKSWGKFCKRTSIHGLGYLAEPNRPWFERLWWGAVVFLGFFTAGYYVSRQFIKWSQTVIEAHSYDEYGDMMEIPFPAFTICDNRKVFYPSNETVDELKHNNLLYMLCGDDRITSSNYTIEDFIQWSPPLIIDCYLQVDDEWDHNIKSNCKSMIVRTLTDQGICYTFNMFDPREMFKDNVFTSHGQHGRLSDWNMETDYNSNTPMLDTNGSDSLNTGPFPKRAKHAIIMSIFHENNYTPTYCVGKSDGFKIILHSPHEMPMVGFRESPWIPLQEDGGTRDKYINIPAHGEILVDVGVRKIVAGGNLFLYYSPKQRRCFFPGERELAFFREYSFNNCHLECLTNHTMRFCKCKDFYMPSWDYDDSSTSKICTGDQGIKCIHYAFDYWDKNRNECNCLPTCTTLEYNSKTWYNNRPKRNEREEDGMNKTVIIVYSTDPKYDKIERRAVYSFVDFIADCGGVFGLFCGVSIISLLEIIYYSVLWARRLI